MQPVVYRVRPQKLTAFTLKQPSQKFLFILYLIKTFQLFIKINFIPIVTLSAVAVGDLLEHFRKL